MIYTGHISGETKQNDGILAQVGGEVRGLEQSILYPFK